MREIDDSTFLVHLTRAQGDKPARRVLQEILTERCIEAVKPHCLFGPLLNGNGDLRHFKVVCFTEAPLHQVRRCVGPIEGRGIELEPYGLVFTKEFIGEKGGNPALYINTAHQDELKNAALELFHWVAAKGFEDSAITKLLPFIGIQDSHREREWRVVGNIAFTHADPVVGLCPEDEIADFQHEFPDVTFISPSWGLDRIITQLRSA